MTLINSVLGNKEQITITLVLRQEQDKNIIKIQVVWGICVSLLSLSYFMKYAQWL